MVLLTAAVVLVLALVLIALPLVAGRTEREGRALWAGIFAALGVGYMMAEIALIQKFVPLLGTTITSAGIVIGSLLVSSGAGSLVSEAGTGNSNHLLQGWGRGSLAGVPFLILPWLLPLLLPLPAAFRVVASLGLVAVPGFIMGTPFPLGLREMARREPGNVPWVWAINGGCSVAGRALHPSLQSKAE